MLKSLSEGGGNPEDQLQGMLENMMTQLMSKDVLYEPLKELHEKVRPHRSVHNPFVCLQCGIVPCSSLHT